MVYFHIINHHINGSESRLKTYTDNIGTFSVGYIQIFVPDNEASTVKDRNYYLEISDENMNITSISGIKVENQMKTSDDNINTQHVLLKPGRYDQQIFVYDDYEGNNMASALGAGDARANIGQKIYIQNKFIIGASNDTEIYTGNRFVKFDGEGYEPVYFINGDKYRTRHNGGNATFRIWYVTKKDGSNWTSQDEMNKANIEDMDIYDNIEDIPDGKICIGIYAETTGGYLARSTGGNNILVIPLKIKQTATIGKTYGITERTKLWIDKLDRSVYTITNKDVEWPTPTWDSENRNYIKTEYDESGNIITGTHSGGVYYGNTVLVVGANLHGDIRAVDSSNANKVNYDLGKNESVVTYSVEPQLDANSNISSQISNVTLKAEVTIPKGLEYVAGSSKRGENTYTEPEITDNSDGSTTLVWYIYGVTSGQTITPITFDANIDNETANGVQYSTKFVVSEVIGEDGITKIGNSAIRSRNTSNREKWRYNI